MKRAPPSYVPPPQTPHLALPTTAHCPGTPAAPDEAARAPFEILGSARQRQSVQAHLPRFGQRRIKVRKEEKKEPEQAAGRFVELYIFPSSPDYPLLLLFILHVSPALIRRLRITKRKAGPLKRAGFCDSSTKLRTKACLPVARIWARGMTSPARSFHPGNSCRYRRTQCLKSL